MKIDRLFSELVYLVNRDVASAKDMAERFEVSVRTVQRDMDTLSLAGIPVLSLRGAKGGYGIMKGYKLDRQLVDSGDIFFILTSLEGISSTLNNREMKSTIEKMKSLVTGYRENELSIRKEKFQIDFSAFNTGKNSPEIFNLLQDAIDKNTMIEFGYSSGKFEKTRRRVEPMTLLFKWFSWYLYGYCHLRNDFRLFRLSRMDNTVLLDKTFKRKEKSFEQYDREAYSKSGKPQTEIVLKFHPKAKAHVEDYLKDGEIEYDSDNSLIVKLSMPEDDWLYGMVLSFGELVEVLEPPHVRKIILEKSINIAEKYRAGQ